MIDTIGSVIWFATLVGFCIYIVYLDIKSGRERAKRMREIEQRVTSLEIDVHLRKD